MNEGIERIRIVRKDEHGNIHFGGNSRGSWRFDAAEKRWPAANSIYRQVFDMMYMPLAPGETIKYVDRNDYQASFDGEFGIDVILRTQTGVRLTLQEKILGYGKELTVTVEYMQDWRNEIRGDWFNLGCQYYFVGYHEPESKQLHSWIMLDWTRTVALTEARQIRWQEQKNKRDGARSSFMYANFKLFPSSCVMGVQYRSNGPSIDPDAWQTPQSPLVR